MRKKNIKDAKYNMNLCERLRVASVVVCLEKVLDLNADTNVSNFTHGRSPFNSSYRFFFFFKCSSLSEKIQDGWLSVHVILQEKKNMKKIKKKEERFNRL